MSNVRVIEGHCIDVLRTLPEASVHCCITSPPYWGLRKYLIPPTVWGGDPACAHAWGANGTLHKGGPHGPGVLLDGGRGVVAAQAAVRDIDTGAFCSHCGAWRGELGLEPTPDLYVAHIVEVFQEVHRVLRTDGTLWLNLGDCYATGAGKVGDHPGGGAQGDRWAGRDDSKGRGTPSRADGTGGHSYVGPKTQPNRMPVPGLKPKDLVGVPWLVALALRSAGWWLRSDIIWSKPSPMPESVTDRPTKSHEYLFLLTKSERYYYDAEAIKEPWSSGRDDMRKHGVRTGAAYIGQQGVQHNSDASSQKAERDQHDYQGGRNKRTVWDVASQPFPEAHFATFPPKLIEPCILAGTSEGGCCSVCGAPRERVLKVEYENVGNRKSNGARSRARKGIEFGSAGYDNRLERRAETLAWSPTCECARLVCPKCENVEVSFGQLEHASVDLPILRHRLHGQGFEGDAEVLRTQMPCSLRSKDAPNNEGVEQDSTRIRDAVSSGSCDGIEGRICDGASASDGREDRSLPAAGRSSKPSKRNQRRQSAGESGSTIETRARPIAQAARSSILGRVSELQARFPGGATCGHCAAPLEAAPFPSVPAVVLDCFGGSGTTGVVASAHGRDAILIELGTEYVSMAERRIANAPMSLFAPDGDAR